MASATMSMAHLKLNLTGILLFSPARTTRSLKPPRCASPQQVHEQNQLVDAVILCEPCSGKGWVLCDFCEGKKTNVSADNKRLYRRCPSCRAVGYVLCSKCKVFKCVTFPNYNDGSDLSF